MINVDMFKNIEKYWDTTIVYQSEYNCDVRMVFIRNSIPNIIDLVGCMLNTNGFMFNFNVKNSYLTNIPINTQEYDCIIQDYKMSFSMFKQNIIGRILGLKYIISQINTRIELLAMVSLCDTEKLDYIKGDDLCIFNGCKSHPAEYKIRAGRTFKNVFTLQCIQCARRYGVLTYEQYAEHYMQYLRCLKIQRDEDLKYILEFLEKPLPETITLINDVVLKLSIH